MEDGNFAIYNKAAIVVSHVQLDTCALYLTCNFLLLFSLVGDFDKIWREHCEDEETLCEYAVAMKNLADNHWAKTCEGEGRIEWCCR